MDKIAFPLEQGMKGESVADLQDALSLLLKQDLIQLSADQQAELERGLQNERPERFYGDVTAKLVSIFQEQHGLDPHGAVDEPTAKVLNAILEELGPTPPGSTDDSRVVGGRVQREDGSPLMGGTVRAFHVTGQNALRLGEDTTDADGRYTIRYALLPGLAAVALRVVVLDNDGQGLRQSDIIDPAQPIEMVDLIVPGMGGETYRVEGRVASRVSAAVGGLRVRIVDKTVGDDVQLADAITDQDGTYRAAFGDADLRRRGKSRPDLQARVFAGDTFLAASEVRYDASNSESLNVPLPDETAPSALSSEHQTLVASLSRHFSGKLGDLQETEDRQDITYLAHKTGWDARAVALAALAEQFSARTAAAGGTGIDAALFYALFRAGLPANETAIYQTDASSAQATWERAITDGVIPAGLENHLPAALEQFQTLAAERALNTPAMIGVSSLKELLSMSLGDDPQQQRQFADLYTRHKATPPKLWEVVGDAFGEPTEKRMKLDGQLAFLTLNNAPLIRKLHAGRGGNGLADPLDLVTDGYYRADTWEAEIGNDRIPPEIPGEDDTEKRARYAELLAAQVRLSYPTEVVAHMVDRGETPVTSASAGAVRDFLRAHQGRFEIGMQPVEQYVLQNDVQAPAEVIEEVTRIQRVYQITPSNEAMNGLLDEGLDSAAKVVRYDRDEFVRTFQNRVGGEADARLIHARAQQVHNAALNIATSFLTAANAPAIGSNPDGLVLYPASSALSVANTSEVIAYPTLERLFGEMDFCDCPHCRSILSPAAYLVDLLLFLDRRTDGVKSPQDVLFDRRPDIQHLPLTCENTNTPLPYIDLVNEVLEYYITADANSNPPKPPLSMKGYIGHSADGSASPEELLASPQFVSVKAYDILAGKPAQPSDPTPLLPPAAPLPFHRPLEQLRRYFATFDASLPEVMEALRQNDDLERPTAVDPNRPVEYGWRDILMEELRLSRREYARLTDGSMTLQQLYGYDPATGTATVLAELSNAKTFSRRVNVSYEDVVEILKTRFVNPNATLIPRLERLGVSFATLKALKDGAITDVAFDEALAPHLDASQYGGDIKAWVRKDVNYENIMSLLILTNPAHHLINRLLESGVPQSALTDLNDSVITDAEFDVLLPQGFDASPYGGNVSQWVQGNLADAGDSCSFDKLEFRYSDPDDIVDRVREFEFVRLIRFVRLWKRLGWTIDQTDKAITALYPANQTPNDPNDAVNLQRLDDGFLVLLPRLGVLKRVMAALNLKPERDLLPLLACFAPMDTHGAVSLYQQLFLHPALLEQDDAFADDGYGNFLIDDTQVLLAHGETLRGAFNLTGAELTQVTAALGYDANTRLRIDNITAIFRRGWLARKLKISIEEFLLLTQHADLDPFAPPDPPEPPILALIGLLDSLRASSIKPASALDLIWNQDITSKATADDAEILDFARILRAALTAVESEFALASDPDGQIARARMALVYGSEATDLFFGFLENTFVTDVTYDHHQAVLEQAISEAASNRVAYDDLRKRLSFAGVLTSSTRDALQAAADATLTSQQAIDFNAAVGSLFSENRKVVGPFFARYPELLSLYDTYIASNEPPEEKRSDLLANFLPELNRRRAHQQALQMISSGTGSDLGLASALLDDAFVLHASGDDTHPALDDLTAMGTPGLAAQFFFRDTATGMVDHTRDAEANLVYAAGGSNRLPANPAPNSAISGTWSGYLEAPGTGFYNIHIEADAGATITLSLDGAPVGLAQNGNTWSNDVSIELRAGTLYAISVKVQKVTNTLAIRWETTGRGREVIPAPYLYSATLTDHLRQVYVRFLKAASLAAALGLTAAETAYLAAHADYQIGGQGWLNALPVIGSPDSTTSVALLTAFSAVLDFARLKADLSPDDERLLDAMTVPLTATENPDSLLFALTGWEPGSLDALLVQFGKVDGGAADLNALKDLDTMVRVYKAYARARKMGVSASALIAATTNEPDPSTVLDLQAALRARYDEGDWLKVLTPINDEMRGLQRDALVAYILHQMRSNPGTAHIDTPEKLFECFLMDVQMEPCMQTSRIRHTLSSVQLFIERCLMNLERDVAPNLIDARQWEWMNRYRVWEANRKVFLYPENWLEPELRDYQSPFFKDAMSELLQSDITEESAAVALLNYLSKLEQVAKLEPCGICYVENDPGKRQDDVAHVISRTPGANREYYYRRLEYGSWTPWERIHLDIEDNPVIPVVWKGRLLLFWLRILKEARLDPAGMSTSPGERNSEGDEIPLARLPLSAVKKSMQKDAQTNAQVDVKAVLCWSEYYNGKWQPTKTSDINRPARLGQTHPAGQSALDRSRLHLSVFEEENRGTLRVAIVGNYLPMLSFRFYNTHSLPEDVELHELSAARTLGTGEDTFYIDYAYQDLSVSIGQSSFRRDVLNRKPNNRTTDQRTVQPEHDLQQPWGAPFFYEDNRHVFYVRTREQIRRIGDWSKYGLESNSNEGVLHMVPLVLEADSRPDRPADGLALLLNGRDLSAAGLTLVEQFITEDAYIDKGIGTTGTVRYGDAEIGPAGGVMNGRKKS